MECHSCGRPAGYNRAVVDVHTEAELGGLCVECEAEAFGRILEHGSWDASDGCVCCPRDGHFALPTWDPERVREKGRVVNKVDWHLDDATPTVCDEHLSELLAPPTTPPVAGRTRRQR